MLAGLGVQTGCAHGKIEQVRRLSPDLVNELRAEGWKADPWVEGAEGVVRVTKAAARALWGMGTGASTLWTTVQLPRGDALLADIDVAATSGGRGGLSAIGELTQAPIEDTVGTIAGYLGDRVPQ